MVVLAYLVWNAAMLLLIPMILLILPAGYFSWMHTSIDELPEGLKLPLTPISLLAKGLSFVFLLPIIGLAKVFWGVSKWALTRFRGYLADGGRLLRLPVRYFAWWGGLIEKLVRRLSPDELEPPASPAPAAS
jgi:hypothetical protein